MATDRVVATEAALRAAQQVQRLLGGGLEQQVRGMAEAVRTLANPTVWDGPRAAEFRNTQAPRHQAALERAVASVRQLGSHASTVTGSIMEAGTQGSGLAIAAVPLVAGVSGIQFSGDGLPSPGSAPAQVNSWWSGLTPEQQQQYESQDPARLGALDGIPADVRDHVNRTLVDSQRSGLHQQVGQLTQQQSQLYQQQADLQNQLVELREQRQLGVDVTTEEGQVEQQLADVKTRIAANDDQIARDQGYISGIDAIDARLKTEPPRAYLLGLDTRGSTGHYIVAINNPDLAQNVATIVPGVNNNLSDPEWGVNAADQIVKHAGQGDQTSAIVWLNYSPPQGIENAVWNHQSAQDGAAGFDHFEQGLVVTNDNSGGTGGLGPHLTAIGHSYGNVLVGNASKGPGGSLPVQDVIAVASPGMDVDSAASFGPGVKVWAGRSINDPISLAGGISGFGEAPVDTGFGATDFNAELAPGDPQSSINPHNAYFDENSHSLANMVRIVTGDYGAVEQVDPPDASPGWSI